MKVAQVTSLIAAAVAVGITAGTLAAFAYSVMPGLHGADDRTFVVLMNRMNDAIQNGFFLTAFLGGVIFSGVALVLHWRESGRDAVPWIVAGLGLYLVGFLITMAINVPMNDKLLTARDAGSAANFAALRHDFEGPWVAWNVIRTVANTAALGFLLYALVVHGRTTATAAERPAPASAAASSPPAPTDGSVAVELGRCGGWAAGDAGAAAADAGCRR